MSDAFPARLAGAADTRGGLPAKTAKVAKKKNQDFLAYL
jgi:hypothetical protein